MTALEQACAQNAHTWFPKADLRNPLPNPAMYLCPCGMGRGRVVRPL